MAAFLIPTIAVPYCHATLKIENFDDDFFGLVFTRSGDRAADARRGIETVGREVHPVHVGGVHCA